VKLALYALTAHVVHVVSDVHVPQRTGPEMHVVMMYVVLAVVSVVVCRKCVERQDVHCDSWQAVHVLLQGEQVLLGVR